MKRSMATIPSRQREKITEVSESLGFPFIAPELRPVMTFLSAGAETIEIQADIRWYPPVAVGALITAGVARPSGGLVSSRPTAEVPS
jgi:hypothetical protein